jgi:hypothetical protein
MITMQCPVSGQKEQVMPNKRIVRAKPVPDSVQSMDPNNDTIEFKIIVRDRGVITGISNVFAIRHIVSGHVLNSDVANASDIIAATLDKMSRQMHKAITDEIKRVTAVLGSGRD